MFGEVRTKLPAKYLQLKTRKILKIYSQLGMFEWWKHYSIYNNKNCLRDRMQLRPDFPLYDPCQRRRKNPRRLLLMPMVPMPKSYHI